MPGRFQGYVQAFLLDGRHAARLGTDKFGPVLSLRTLIQRGESNTKQKPCDWKILQRNALQLDL